MNRHENARHDKDKKYLFMGSLDRMNRESFKDICQKIPPIRRGFSQVLILACFCGILAFSLDAHAKSIPPASILIDAKTGKILLSERPNALWHPASLTKLMTLYIVFEDLKANRLHLNDEIKLSAGAVAQSENRTGLAPNSKIPLQDTIYATILISANDAASAIAEHIGGSEAQFVQRMNETAKKLGMTRTNFINATGLPDEKQLTTARDMALLAFALYRDFPEYYRYFGTGTARVKNRSIHNINPILANYQGADGLKTGFTCASGYNLVASAERDGRRLIAVLLGGMDPADRLRKMTRLLNDGFSEMPNPWLKVISDPVEALSEEEQQAAPNILGGAGCVTGHGAIYAYSGWAVILGAFPSREQANKQIALGRKLLGSVKGGQPSIVRRTYEGITRHNALLTGLSQQEAGKICKILWAKNTYCLALAPSALNSAAQPWR